MVEHRKIRKGKEDHDGDAGLHEVDPSQHPS